MIELIGNWLKEIIFVVMMAAFADLLLPNNNLQKYVKLILSLFVLMTILSPIISFITGDWNQRLQTAAESLNTRQPGASGQQMDDLESIIRTGEAIKQQQQETARAVAESEIAARIKEQIEERTGLEAVILHIEIGEDSKGQWEIQSAAVELEREREQSLIGQDRIAQIIPVKPVEPIRIGSREDSAVSAVVDTGHTNLGEREPLLEETAEWLHREWNIPRKSVEVRYADERRSSDELEHSP